MKIVQKNVIEETKTTTKVITKLEDKVKINGVGELDVSIIDHDGSLAFIVIKGEIETHNLKEDTVLFSLPKKYATNYFRPLRCLVYNDRDEMVGTIVLFVKGENVIFHNLFTTDNTTKAYVGVGYSQAIS